MYTMGNYFSKSITKISNDTTNTEELNCLLPDEILQKNKYGIIKQEPKCNGLQLNTNIRDKKSYLHWITK